MEQFTVGQKVTVVHSFGRQVSNVTTVESVGKAKIKTSDGLEWKARNGSRWGTTDKWGYGARIRAWENGDDQALRRSEALSWVKSFSGWDALSTDDLETVAEIIRRTERQRGVKMAEAKS